MHHRHSLLESKQLRWIVATCCIIAATVIIWSAGLPDRALTDATDFSSQNGINQPVAPEIGALAPPFMAMTITGQTISLMSLRGSPTILNFWATWCGPCIAEMPMIQHTYDAYYDKGLRVILINSNELLNDVLAWNAHYGLTADTIIDGGSIAKLYRLRGLPTTVFIRRDGIIQNVVYGSLNQQMLDTTISDILN